MYASTTNTGRFTDQLWDRTKDLRVAIEELEFLRRLGDGTLPPEVFRTYIEQDSLYLTAYSKALAILASKSPDPRTAAFWATSSATAAAVESTMHDELLNGGALPPREGEPEHSQTCLAYVSFLIATAATESYAVAAAAALPCFWIYAEVGRDLAESAAKVIAADPDHPYARWVTTYGAEEFQNSAVTARALVDEAAESASERDRDAMATAFTIATRYELMFWDTALHPQPWPAS
ncbi:TenA family protein [Nocardia puris]|uniref:TenA family protein n=1 Tax=Nocardia puris TaxID=208602 RepID=UPI001893C98F|nr:TenA family protein [Nocardia puris]MBF6209740.1 TenA family protein [Nocardia puris]MBF6366312.1 TenA family protein [Nocardia puris]MBF6458349.1 TenA family protein [Nocardia puris]